MEHGIVGDLGPVPAGIDELDHVPERVVALARGGDETVLEVEPRLGLLEVPPRVVGVALLGDPGPDGVLVDLGGEEPQEQSPRPRLGK